MEALPLFVELPFFERYRGEYLTDEEYRKLQKLLIDKPEAGDRIKGTGGIRKVRYGDKHRGKGTRGGIRIIYYYQVSERTFLLFTLYNKDEVTDLTEGEKKLFKQALTEELAHRRRSLT